MLMTIGGDLCSTAIVNPIKSNGINVKSKGIKDANQYFYLPSTRKTYDKDMDKILIKNILYKNIY